MFKLLPGSFLNWSFCDDVNRFITTDSCYFIFFYTVHISHETHLQIRDTVPICSTNPWISHTCWWPVILHHITRTYTYDFGGKKHRYRDSEFEKLCRFFRVLWRYFNHQTTQLLFASTALFQNRVSAQSQMNSSPLIFVEFTVFNFTNEILAHEFGLTSFSEKSFLVGIRYLFAGSRRKCTNDWFIWSVQMQNFTHMVGRLKRCRCGHPIWQQEAEDMLGKNNHSTT